jgi:predicted nucleic acid-binding protein
MAIAAQSQPRLKIALDSNVLFDLAAEENFAATVLEVLREKDAEIYVPPTVLTELLYEEEHCVVPAKGKLASRALDSIHSVWKLKQVTLEANKEAIARRFASALRDERLLDPREINDCFILAESTQIPANFLLTSDKLHALFDEKHVPRVEIVAPRKVFRLLRGK